MEKSLMVVSELEVGKSYMIVTPREVFEGANEDGSDAVFEEYIRTVKVIPTPSDVTEQGFSHLASYPWFRVEHEDGNRGWYRFNESHLIYKV